MKEKDMKRRKAEKQALSENKNRMTYLIDFYCAFVKMNGKNPLIMVC